MREKKEKLFYNLIRVLFFIVGSMFVSLSVNAGVDEVVSTIERIEKEEASVAVSKRASITALINQEKPKEEESIKSLFTMSIMGGKSDFNIRYKNHQVGMTTDFLKSDYSGGFALGMRLTKKISVEGSLMYAQFAKPKGQAVTQINYTPWGSSVRPAIYDVEEQYRFGGHLKYRLWDAFITPVVAVGADYLTHKSMASNQWFSYVGQESGFASSIALTPSIGLELNLWGLRIGIMGKWYTTLVDLSAQQNYYYNRPWNMGWRDPNELKNYKNLFEGLGVVTFDL